MKTLLVFLIIAPLLLDAQVSFVSEACEVCREVYKDVKNALPDIAAITTDSLLDATKTACDSASSKPEEVATCKEIAIAVNKNVYDFIKKEGRIGPNKICQSIVVCKSN